MIDPSELNFIISNPPFVGYSNQNEEQKKDLLQFSSRVKSCNSLDYVSGWYLKASDYITEYSIKCAFVSTNSICQGEQAVWLWEPLCKEGIVINYAYQTFVWSSNSTDSASVHCVIVGFSKCVSHNCCIFTKDGTKLMVDTINPYLVAAPTVFVESRKQPISDISLEKMQLGIDPTDYGNLTFSDEDKEDFVKLEPNSERYFKPYLDGRSFLHGIRRWYLDLNDCTDLDSLPLCKQRVENVIAARSNAQSEATRKRANEPLKPKQGWYPNSDYLIVPRVSSERRDYIPIGFCSKNVVSSMQNQVIPKAKLYHLGVLTSSVHMSWMRTVAGRLKSDYRYSAGIVFNNFPWCLPTNDQRKSIEHTAQGILDARANHPDKSLADLYDPDKMPNDLKAAHEANDKAVMDAYGFSYNMTEPEIVAELMKMYQKLTEDK